MQSNLKLVDFPKLHDDLRTFWNRKEGKLILISLFAAGFFIIFNWDMVSAALLHFIGRLVWGTIQFIITVSIGATIVLYLMFPKFRIIVNGWFNSIIRILVLKSPVATLKVLFEKAVNYDKAKITAANANRQTLIAYIETCEGKRNALASDLESIVKRVEGIADKNSNEWMRLNISGTNTLKMVKAYDTSIQENKAFCEKYKNIIEQCEIRLESNKGQLEVETQKLELQSAKKSIILSLLPMFDTSGFNFLTDEALSIAQEKFARDEKFIIDGNNLIEPTVNEFQQTNELKASNFLSEYANYNK